MFGDPVSVGVGIGILVSNAPKWYSALQETLLSKGKEATLDKGKAYIQSYFDERKHQRHVELALQNAAERGLKQWHTTEERTHYRHILEILSETESEALRREAMKLFTLSDNPDLKNLSDQFQLSQRITALAHHISVEEVNAAPYLQSFFEALLIELYNDPLFREPISDIIRTRTAMQEPGLLSNILHMVQQEPRLLSDILNTLQGINDLLEQQHDYSVEQLQQNVDTYLKHIEEKYRRHKFAGIPLIGNEEKAPELDAIFIPLRVALQQPPASSPTEKPDDNLVALLERNPYIVVLGKPGSGKSTTTCYLAWSHAQANIAIDAPATSTGAGGANEHKLILPNKPVPVRIELRMLSEARRQNPEYSFLSYVSRVLLGRENISIPVEMFETLLERRAMLVLFDGLDEVPKLGERRQLVDDIETFAQTYPGNHILVTSRPVGYELASVTDHAFQHANLQDLNDEEIHQFLESWYTHVLKYSPLPFEARQELETLYTTLQGNDRLHTLATNPLLLTVMTALHHYQRLPDERVLIYERCAELLLDTWARLKHEGERWKNMKTSKTNQQACLAYLGFVLHQRSQERARDRTTTDPENEQTPKDTADTAVDVPESFLRKEILRFLADQNLLSGADQHKEAELFLDMVRTEAGLMVSRGTDEVGDSLYGFVHRTFQEYFAAMDVRNRYEQEGDLAIIRNFLSNHAHDPHWREVILLLLGKLRPKLVTTQLRLILKGNTRRSTYAETLKQDLFFVSDCLADGISVEKDFAQEAISALIPVIKNSPIPSQRREAASALAGLRRARHYADLARQALLMLITASDIPLPTQIEVAESVYDNTPSGSDENRDGARLLLTRYQQGFFSFDQQLLMALAIYQYSPFGSDEKREALRLLSSLFHHQQISFEQQLLIARIIYRYNPYLSDEEREGARLLLSLYQQDLLSFEQQIQVAQAICEYSSFDSDEKREGSRLLSSLFHHDQISLEQQLLIAQAFSKYGPSGSDQQREGARLLLSLYQQDLLSFEQQIQVAQVIYQYSSFDSDEKREGFRLLSSLFHHDQISLEQQLLVAQTLYLDSSLGSDAHREALRLLSSLFHQENLTLEQQLLVVQAVYRHLSVDSDEGLSASSLIQQYAQSSDIPFEQRILLLTLPCEIHRDNFVERATAIRTLLTLMSQEAVADILREKWRWTPLSQEHRFVLGRKRKPRYESFVTSIPAMIELAKQKVLPEEAREEMYELLREMVPVFDQLEEDRVRE